MKKDKCGRKPYDASERGLIAAMKAAIQDREDRHRRAVNEQMRPYRKRHNQLAIKARAATQAGLTYGYYVALVLEGRGRLNF